MHPRRVEMDAPLWELKQLARKSIYLKGNNCTFKISLRFTRRYKTRGVFLSHKKGVQTAGSAVVGFYTSAAEALKRK